MAPLIGGVDYGILPSTNIVNLNANWNSIGGGPIDLGFRLKYRFGGD